MKKFKTSKTPSKQRRNEKRKDLKKSNFKLTSIEEINFIIERKNNQL